MNSVKCEDIVCRVGGQLVRPTDEQLDAVYWKQVMDFRESELVMINAEHIELCIKWVNVFDRTSKEEKFARNSLMSVLESQLASSGSLEYPFLDVRNCNRDLNVVYKKYLSHIDMQHQRWMKQKMFGGDQDGENDSNNEDESEDENEADNEADSEGESEAESEAENEADSEGESEEESEGENEDVSEGKSEDDNEGDNEGGNENGNEEKRHVKCDECVGVAKSCPVIASDPSSDIEPMIKSTSYFDKLPTIIDIPAKSLRQTPTKSDLTLRVQEEIKALQELDSTTDLYAKAWESAQHGRKAAANWPIGLTSALTPQNSRSELMKTESQSLQKLLDVQSAPNAKLQICDSLGLIEIKKPALAMRESRSQLSLEQGVEWEQQQQRKAPTPSCVDVDHSVNEKANGDQAENMLKGLREQNVAMRRELEELSKEAEKVHSDTMVANAELIQRRYESIKFDSTVEDTKNRLIASCADVITDMEACLQRQSREFSVAKEKLDCRTSNDFVSMLPDYSSLDVVVEADKPNVGAACSKEGAVGDASKQPEVVAGSKAMPVGGAAGVDDAAPEVPAVPLPSGIFGRMLATLAEDDESTKAPVAVKELNQRHYDVALLDARFDAALHKRFESFFEGRKSALAEELTAKYEHMRKELSHRFNRAVEINTQTAKARRRHARVECLATLREIFAEFYDADQENVWQLFSELEAKYMKDDK